MPLLLNFNFSHSIRHKDDIKSICKYFIKSSKCRERIGNEWNPRGTYYVENAIEGNIIFGFDNIWEYDVITKK
jgi:hypothetical protein